MERIPFLIRSFATTRGYTNAILDRIPETDWFQMPTGGVTHVAWQVGHLAIAEYALALTLIRGKQPTDLDLIGEDYNEKFGRTSIPNPDPAANPTPEELRTTFDRVHQQALKELHELGDGVLDEPVDRNHPMFKDKFGSLCWCSQHEFNHAGQLSLIRRLLGGKFSW